MSEKTLLRSESNIERQNILNNPYVMENLQKDLDFIGIAWAGKPV